MPQIKPPVDKLPLAVRINVRDGFESKKEQLEAKITELLGQKWTIEINPNAIFPYSVEGSYGRDSLGECLTAYVEATVATIEQFVKDYADLGGKDEMNDSCSKHSLTMDVDSTGKVSYCGCDIHDGRLRILFADGQLGVNIANVAEKLPTLFGGEEVVAAPSKEAAKGRGGAAAPVKGTVVPANGSSSGSVSNVVYFSGSHISHLHQSMAEWQSREGKKFTQISIHREREASLTSMATAAVSGFAERELTRYGWKHGTGLGKRRDGVTRHVTVGYKNDTKGLGAQSNEFGFAWWDHLFNASSAAITVTRSDGDGGISVASSGDARRAAGKKELYSGFVRAEVTAKTYAGGEGKEATEEAKKIFEEEEKRWATTMTDQELFEACEGRTAHKGARKNVEGKLARVDAALLVKGGEDRTLTKADSVERAQLSTAESSLATETERQRRKRERKERRERKELRRAKKRANAETMAGLISETATTQSCSISDVRETSSTTAMPFEKRAKRQNDHNENEKEEKRQKKDGTTANAIEAIQTEDSVTSTTNYEMNTEISESERSKEEKRAAKDERKRRKAGRKANVVEANGLNPKAISDDLDAKVVKETDNSKMGNKRKRSKVGEDEMGLADSPTDRPARFPIGPHPTQNIFSGSHSADFLSKLTQYSEIQAHGPSLHSRSSSTGSGLLIPSSVSPPHPSEDYSVVKVSNIPWEVSCEDLRTFFSFVTRVPHGHTYPTFTEGIHIPMSRETGKTLPYAFVEIPTVGLSWSSRAELTAALFPSASEALGNYLTEGEVLALFEICQNYKQNPVEVRPVTQVSYAVPQKFEYFLAFPLIPVFSDTGSFRLQMFQLYRVSVEVQSNFPDSILTRMIRAFLVCEAFTEEQKVSLLQATQQPTPSDLAYLVRGFSVSRPLVPISVSKSGYSTPPSMISLPSSGYSLSGPPTSHPSPIASVYATPLSSVKPSPLSLSPLPSIEAFSCQPKNVHSGNLRSAIEEIRAALAVLAPHQVPRAVEALEREKSKFEREMFILSEAGFGDGTDGEDGVGLGSPMRMGGMLGFCSGADARAIFRTPTTNSFLNGFGEGQTKEMKQNKFEELRQTRNAKIE
ncbi:hypothetical protein HDU93_003265 [Gonapodya sp. JEL0774]|nr:hypothetical protein HDU93_003265 [Gonapodya sp. JEL0774]